jgi:hypothetical protein
MSCRPRRGSGGKGFVSKFSAGPQTVGYLNQIRYALVTLLDHEVAKLRLETLDDIDLSSAKGPSHLFQLKHRADGTDVTDFSPDLWKSIRVWAAQILDGTITDTATIFTLITTATAQSNSAVSLLRDDAHRDPQTALTKLNIAAVASASDVLKPAFKAFLELSPLQRQGLLSKVYVIDQSPNILEARAALEGRLALAVPRAHRSALADRVEGWWFRICVEHLTSTSQVKSPF